jgi:hypothetical protein
LPRTAIVATNSKLHVNQFNEHLLDLFLWGYSGSTASMTLLFPVVLVQLSPSLGKMSEIKCQPAGKLQKVSSWVLPQPQAAWDLVLQKLDPCSLASTAASMDILHTVEKQGSSLCQRSGLPTWSFSNL